MAELPCFTDLTLILTEQCNLRCGYCYVPKTDRAMSEELALRATDFLLDRAPAGAALSLSFFGGEPFLARERMARVMGHARGRRPDGLRFTAPTNGTLLDDAALRLVRENPLSVALSLDGAAASADRPAANGAGSLERLRPLLAEVRDLHPILRMTVTPQNVEHLADNVITLFSWGFERIMHQPALEEPWSDEACATWTAEHRRLADWLVERYATREPIPDLVTLEGISHRLGGGAAGSCGAGVTQAAVSIDGQIFGCYRSVYDPRAARLVLGDLCGGPVNETLLATYARLHPSRALPEEGSCASCEARAGCTCYCPAMGHVLLGDLRAVSARACRLMRPQVAIVREAMVQWERADRARRRSVGAHVAAAALALTLTTGAAACDSGRPTIPGDARVEGLAPGVCAHRYDSTMGGLCPPPLPDGLIGGVCPVQLEGGVKKDGVKKDGPVKKDMLGPGLCPYKPDALTPGLCDPKPDFQWMPGLCAYKPDFAMPGVCPQPSPDLAVKKDGPGPVPGLCPMPGLCPIPGIC